MLDYLTFSIDEKRKKNIQRCLFTTLAILYIAMHILDINTPYLFLMIDFITLFSLILFTRNTDIKQSYPIYIMFLICLFIYFSDKRLDIYFYNYNNYASATLFAYSALL